MRTTAVPRTAINRLSLFAPLLALTLGAATAQADLSSWPYAMKIDVSGYNRSEVLTNFPVLVVLSNNLAGFTYAAMNSPSNGADLRFSVDKINEINYEIDQWDTNGVSRVWVQVPAFSNTASLYAHWGAVAGQPAYTTNGATWSNNYVAVWHLGEQLAAGLSGGTNYDSTTNANYGIQSKNGWTNGIIGRAQNFDRTATINCGAKASLRPTNITISAWIKPRSITYTTYVEIYRKEDGSRHIFAFQMTGTQLTLGLPEETDTPITASDFTDGQWHQVVGTYDGAYERVFKDGLEIGKLAKSGALSTSSTANGYIGSSAGSSEFFDGFIDQVEISGVGRSSNWVWASYMQVVSNQPFLAYNTYTVSGAPFIANRTATNVTATSAWLNGYLSSTGTAPTTVAVYYGTQDGGAPTTGLWQATNTWSQGDWAQGSYPTFQVTPLAANNFYYYRYAAWNTGGTNWANTSTNFMAAPVTILATTPVASEDGPVTGIFTVARSASLTNEPVTVNYVVSASATPVTDYAPLSGSVLLAAGQASNTILVAPVMDGDPEGDEYVTVTLSNGLYIVGSPDSDTVTIHDRTPQTWYCALTNTQNKNWSDSTTWTNAAGQNGVPTIFDAAIVRTLASGNFTLNLDAGWNAKSLTLNSIASTDHRLNVGNGYAETLTFSNASPNGFVGLYWEAGASKVTVSKLLCVGPQTPNWRSTSYTSILAFTNAAEMVYHTTNRFDFANKYDFSGATSVSLAASARLSVTNNETMGSQGGNIAPPLVIGRNDNGVQNWTVAAGSHPLMRVTHYTQSSVISKVGVGNVNMPDVDWYIPFGNNCGISPDGQYGYSSGLYQGTITAHSLKLEGANAVNFGICGHLVLTGQGGLQAGGAGNGHALNVTIGGTNECNVHIGSGYWGGLNWTPGKLECSPTAGDLFLSCSSPTSRLKFVTCGFNRASTPNSNQVAIVANTINIASTNVYMTDRGPDDEAVDAYAGGQIEFRGDFISQSTLTNQFRLDSSTLRTIGGLTNEVQYWECMSQDLGAVPAGFTNNFALGRLVLGQSSVGATTKADLVLRNQSDNNLAGALAEAVYVTNLTMYANSCLYLNGFNLYYKNGGSWQKAVPGAFAPGDGTGRIREIWPVPSGTTFKFR